MEIVYWIRSKYYPPQKLPDKIGLKIVLNGRGENYLAKNSFTEKHSLFLVKLPLLNIVFIFLVETALLSSLFYSLGKNCLTKITKRKKKFLAFYGNCVAKNILYFLEKIASRKMIKKTLLPYFILLLKIALLKI